MEPYVSSVLNTDSMRELLAGRNLAIRIPAFMQPSACDEILSRIDAELDQGESQSSIYLTNDVPFYSVRDDSNAQAAYLTGALESVRKFRRLCSPLLSPADAIRLTLDEEWPAGATLMRLHGKQMFFGITRVWRPGTQALPHQDVLERELSEVPSAEKFLGQLGVNLYLETAQQGGALKMWKTAFSGEQAQELGKDGSYGFAENTLSSEAVTIIPEKGDLILINTLFVHAVLPIKFGRRTTVSGFVGYRDEASPLVLWS